MFKKIIYIVKTQLHYYPPCVSQIRMLNKLGVDIEVIYGTSNDSAISLLESEGVNCKKIGRLDDDNTTFIRKIKSWYAFRVALKKELKLHDQNTLLWFGTAETAIPMKGLLKRHKYVISLLELLDEYKIKRYLLKDIVKKAVAVTVCEETRGYIVKYWWKISKLPYIFPNKPYDQLRKPHATPSCERTYNEISKINGKEFIIYQGVLQNTEELEEVAKALAKMNSNLSLVLMGIDKYNSIEKIKKIYKDTIYINYVPAPLHLEITSYAKIGLTFYRPDSLNKVFCAPNKIYEYTGFGIPIICNNIPGLSNTIGVAKAAVCTDLTCNNIIKAINEINDSYNEFQKNALAFFESEDTLATMKKVANELKIAGCCLEE